MILETQPYKDLHGAPEVRLEFCIPNMPLDGTGRIVLTYTPHKHVVDTQVLNDWVQNMGKKNYTTWEDFATAVIDAFYDTVLPRKVDLNYFLILTNDMTHNITLTRSQPVMR